MKIGIVLLLLVFGQYAYADDRYCNVVNYATKDRIDREINDYVLEQCQDGDVLALRVTNIALALINETIEFAVKHCKTGTIQSLSANWFICDYRKIPRDGSRPSKKEWKQMKKNSEK
jgi:hypothetical protein